jgi:hypothetical protein
MPSFANVGGNWSGTLSYTTLNSAGNPINVAYPLSMALTQTSANVTGTWSSPLADGTTRSGAVSGTTTATTFSGSFTYQHTNSSGTLCTGNFIASGTAGGSPMTWTSSGVAEKNCTNTPTNMTMTVVRQ